MIIYNVKTFNEDNILKALEKKINENIKLAKLQEYYNGLMEIDKRYYSDPTKPNNKIKANYCKDITDFLTAYLVGVPVKIENISNEVKQILINNEEDSELQQLVTDMNINGFGAELFYFNENGDIKFNNINPLECVVFMNDDLQEDIIGFLRVIKNDIDVGGWTCTLYTNETYRTLNINESLSSVVFGEEKQHHFTQVPIVLYRNNEQMQGCFEQIIPMQDALNKIISDTVNDYEGFVDAYLCLEGMQGTSTEDIEQMKNNRVLLLDSDSKAYWLTKTVNNEHIKTLQDDLRATILELGNVPDLKDIKGMNISGEAMKMRLTKTEIQASRQERVVYKGLINKLKFLSYADNLITNGEFKEPIITFTRNFIMGDKEDKES